MINEHFSKIKVLGVNTGVNAGVNVFWLNEQWKNWAQKYPPVHLEGKNSHTEHEKFGPYIKKNYPQYIAQGFNTESYSTAVAQFVKKK